MDNSYYGQLAVFHAIAREGGISAGARKLGIATPSASQALKLLEAKTGVPLFQRTTRTISLTDAGRQLLAATEPAMQSLNQALAEVQDFGESPKGTVRITLSRFAYQLLIRPFLAEFQTAFPDIQLDISLEDAMVNLAEDGVDLGIRFGNRLEEGVVAKKLLDPFREGLYISPDYAARHGIPQHPSELVNHKLVGYRFITSNRVEPLILAFDGQEQTVETQTVLMCNDPEVIADSTRAGLGIGRIFEPNASRLPDRENFIPILQPYWRSYPPLYLYYLKHSQRAKRVQAVIGFLGEKSKLIA